MRFGVLDYTCIAPAFKDGWRASFAEGLVDFVPSSGLIGFANTFPNCGPLS